MALFTAGIVLLLNIWGGKRSGLSTDPAKEMADVHKCMKMLRALEPQCVVHSGSVIQIVVHSFPLQLAYSWQVVVSDPRPLRIRV